MIPVGYEFQEQPRCVGNSKIKNIPSQRISIEIVHPGSKKNDLFPDAAGVHRLCAEV